MQLINRRTRVHDSSRSSRGCQCRSGLFSVRRAQELKPSAGRTLEPPPAGVTGILKRLLAQPPSTINTDWFGTMILVGALRWHHRVPEVEAFALAWLTHHLNTTDVAPYSGNRS